MEQKAKILLVDDDPDILDSMSAVLTTHEYTVVTARDGQDGLDKLRSEKPDLMILDLMMPRMDGFAVCEELLDPRWAKYSNIPIIILDVGQRRCGPAALRAWYRLTAKGQRLHRETHRSAYFADESGELPEEKRVTDREEKDSTPTRERKLEKVRWIRPGFQYPACSRYRMGVRALHDDEHGAYCPTGV